MGRASADLTRSPPPSSPGQGLPATPHASRGRTARFNRIRPTASGWVFLALLAGVAIAALNTGNNLLYLLLGLLCALLLLNNVLAEWNLRNLVVGRRLPGECFADQAVAGGLILGNGRRFLPAFSVELCEVEDGVARALFLALPCRAEVEAPATFRFRRRGWVHLSHLRVASAFPFGLLTRWQDIPLSADALVYPTREMAPRTADEHVSGAVREDDRRSGGTGEFLSLRPYEPGDPLRQVHWPSTARMGTPMVVVRCGEVADEIRVQVDDTVRGPAWEREIRRACGQADHHFRLGRAVGLQVGPTNWAPRTGEAWRRRVLTLLALLPESPAPTAAGLQPSDGPEAGP